MRRLSPPNLALRVVFVVSTLALISCGDDTPTQPTSLSDPPITGPSLAAASNTWTQKASLLADQYFGGYSVGMAPNAKGESIVYVIGGSSSDNGSTGYRIEAYNTVTNSWTNKSSSADAFGLNGVGKIGSRLYFSGGADYGSGSLAYRNTLWAYDYTNDRLVGKAHLPVYSGNGVTGVIGGKLYVLPGTCSGDSYPSPGFCAAEAIRKLYRYDPSTNTWATKASAPHFHKHGAAGVINNKFYVAAGFNDFDPVAALDVYDPATNTWKTLASIPGGGGGARGAVIQGLLFVVVSGGAYAYNPATNKWTAKAVPPPTGEDLTRVFINGSPYLFLPGQPSQLYTP
ncbi:MAG TPA: kelch repeat-containing protein [Gemmatimonadales bacterium]|nr:kelch repeat-containing protein [Gemmatimonadales bacterium]